MELLLMENNKWLWHLKIPLKEISYQLIQLKVYPLDWQSRENFKEADESIKSLKIINDDTILKRKNNYILQTFSSNLAKKEEQFWYLLQIGEKHRTSIIS